MFKMFFFSSFWATLLFTSSLVKKMSLGLFILASSQPELSPEFYILDWLQSELLPLALETFTLLSFGLTPDNLFIKS